jgi:hypothetical protein
MPASEHTRYKIPVYLHPLWSQVSKAELGVHFTNATHTVFRYKGALDTAILWTALQQLCAAHRIVSARIADLLDGPAILFDRAGDLVPIYSDLRSLPRQDREANARKQAHELIWRPFTPDKGPLMRAFAIRISQADYIIGFTLHHFVADLVSVRIVAKEWLLRYEHLSRHGKTISPPPSLPFEDHLARMTAWVESGDAQKARTYWGEHLRNAGPTWLPRRMGPRPAKADRLITRPVSIGKRATRAVRRFAASHGATVFQVLVAAKIFALAQIGGTRDATLMFFSTCRDAPQLMGTVGALTNLLHLRVQSAPGDTLEDMVGKVRAAHTGAIKHQRCPFELVREMQPRVGAWNDLPYAPLFNFMDVHRPTRPRKAGATGPLRASTPFDIGPPPPVALRDVEFESYYFQLVSEKGGLDGFLRYSPLLYEDAVVERYLNAFCEILEGISPDE